MAVQDAVDPVGGSDWLANQFETHRAHLRAVAYRMLGSLNDAEDAVQEAWLRLSSADAGGIENLGGWLTTVVARVCLDMLRVRVSRREEHLAVHVPDPIVTGDGEIDPEQEALQADAVGLALLVALETLAPAERLAFVLHDVFGVPFEEIASIVGRSPGATRQIASRARRRVRRAQGAAAAPEADHERQREVVDAFLAAARGGSFEALVAVLDPDVVLRADAVAAGAAPAAGVAEPGATPGAVGAAGAAGVAARAGRGAPVEVRGAPAVAAQALSYAGLAPAARPVRVNGAPGFLVAPGGRPFAVLGITVARGKIVAIDVFTDPARLRRAGLSAAP